MLYLFLFAHLVADFVLQPYWLVLTDHSPRLKIARGLSAGRLARQITLVRAIDQSLGTDFTFFIFDRTGRKPQLVGGVTLSNIRRRAAQQANLGYWMGKDFAGKGMMSEAVDLLLPFVFDTLSLHRLHAAFLPHNMASRRVLEKNGFKEDGYAESYLQIDGKWADHVLFALTRERWDSLQLSRR